MNKHNELQPSKQVSKAATQGLGSAVKCSYKGNRRVVLGKDRLVSAVVSVGDCPVCCSHWHVTDDTWGCGDCGSSLVNRRVVTETSLTP